MPGAVTDFIMRRVGSTLYYLLADHLGSTTVAAASDASLQSRQVYGPWGEVHGETGALPTSFQFTGQRKSELAGVHFFQARWYDSLAGVFLQPDSLVPDPYNPLDWNRFLFVRANPINFNDPSGHFPVTIVAGLGIGAIVGGVIYGATTIASGRDFQASELLVSIGVGAAGGALIGTGVGASAGVAAMASIGAGTGVIGSQIGYSATSGKEFESSKLVATSAVGGVTGAATGVLGAPTGINPVSNQALAFGARMAVNGVSGGIDYALSEAMSRKTPSIDGLKISVGVGLTAGLVGEALPGYKSQTLDFYGGQVFQRSPVTAYNEFNGTLRSFAQKELLWQGVDDAIRSGGVSALTNYLNENLK